MTFRQYAIRWILNSLPKQTKHRTFYYDFAELVGNYLMQDGELNFVMEQLEKMVTSWREYKKAITS